MRHKRLRISILLIGLLVVVLSGWLLIRTPAPTATIGYFGENRFLCVRPGQLICLRFSKPLPSGIEEWRRYLKQMGADDAVVDYNPEAIAAGQYWAGLGTSDWWYVSEKEFFFFKQKTAYEIYPIEFPSPKKLKSGEGFEFMLFIIGDKDLDRIVQRQERLPPSGKIPSKGAIEVYYSEPSLWTRFRFWLHQHYRQHLAQATVGETQ